jgi:hypothetical protein
VGEHHDAEGVRGHGEVTDDALRAVDRYRDLLLDFPAHPPPGQLVGQLAAETLDIR